MEGGLARLSVGRAIRLFSVAVLRVRPQALIDAPVRLIDEGAQDGAGRDLLPGHITKVSDEDVALREVRRDAGKRQLVMRGLVARYQAVDQRKEGRGVQARRLQEGRGVQARRLQ